MIRKNSTSEVYNRVTPPQFDSSLLGENSTTYANGDPIKLDAGVAAPAGATGEIYGFIRTDEAEGTGAFAANNESVGLLKVTVELADPLNLYIMETDGSAPVIGVLYKLDSNKAVDVSAGAQTTDAQVQVVKNLGDGYVAVRVLQSK
jgi:hypothetical protein